MSDAAPPHIEITTLNWVPAFARGFVRDLRPRWACEEAGFEYDLRLIDVADRPEWHFKEQPWGQVPTAKIGNVRLFESGSILLHLGEYSDKLLPSDPQWRADAISWVFAALNSVEPMVFELGNITLFAKDEEWAKLRRDSLHEALARRLSRLADAMDTREWLAGNFSIADIAMATVLREVESNDRLEQHPVLCDYLERALARPAFGRALQAQFDTIDSNAPEMAD